ncbi:MAG TPA: tetratricopeptide repeat protein [Caulobacteraceae bacterium]|nr:tetratricopeptide repeat protein [Caulobacteraceae bacterium]
MRRWGVVAAVTLAIMAAGPAAVAAATASHADELMDQANAALDAKDLAKARALMTEAAASGDPEAVNGLGVYTLQGVGAAPDPARARALYEQAVAAGSMAARVNLGTLLAEEPDQTSRERAFALLTEAAAKEPRLASGTFYPLGRMALLGVGRPQDMALGVDLLEKSLAVAPDNADALYLLGRAYANGWGGRTPDAAKSADFFRRAAEDGDFRAQRYFAMDLLEGRGVAQDKRQAYDWFLKAANGGYRDAMIDVAAMLSTGEGGVPVDQPLGRTWYLKAAEMGSALGLQGLGYMLVVGEGGPIDLPHGWAYLELAAEAGNPQARQLETMARFQTPPESRAEVDRIKAAFAAAHPISHTNSE